MATETLYRKVEESPKVGKGREGKKNISFAEQYLEKPVYDGEGAKDYEMAKFTATMCTYRGVPLWDDF